MDRPDDMKHILETLRLETLEDIPLPRLSGAIKEHLPADVDKRQILDIYIMWLYPRLMAIDVSAKGHIGLEVFYLYHFLEALPGDDSRLADAFHDWQCGQAVGNSDISERLRIAEAEFRELAPAVQKPSERSTGSLVSEDRFGHMHPDRAKLSQENRTGIEVNEDKDDGDIIFVSSNSVRGHRGSGRGNGSDGRPELSFLTGSNKLPLVGSDDPPVSGSKKPPVVGSNKLSVSGKDMITHNMNLKGSGSSKSQGKPVSKPKGAPGSKSATPATPSQSKVPDGPQKLHREYVCSRCKMKGDHVFKDCPILDPSFDKKLPRGYICRICMKKSDHHVSMCPLNTDPESMTQRRLASMKHKGHPSVEGRGGPRENLPAEAENRSRSPPLEPNKHIAKDAQGPQKEISSGRRARAQRRSRKRKAAPSPPTPPKKGTPALEMGEIMEIKGDLAVSPNSEAKEPFKRRLVSYADQVEETHEGNSRVTGHQLFEPTSRKTNTSAREIRRSLTVSPNLEVKELFKRRLVSYDNEADEKHESNSHVNDQRKRKASPSPPTSRKKGTPALEMGEIREIKKTRSDLMVSPGLEADEPFKRRLVSSGDEADEKHESNSCVSRQLFEPAVLELIRVESAKTDLVQVDTPSNPFSAFSLRDQGGVFQVNETANQPRPRAADFYDPCDDDEQLVESVETEMPADIEAAGNHERVPWLTQEMAELTGLENPAAVGKKDTVMAEHGPETASVASTDAACPTMLTTGSFQSEQPPIPTEGWRALKPGASPSPPMMDCA